MKYKIFGKKQCPWCDKAILLLKLREIEFQYMDIDDNELIIQGLKDEGINSVPAVFRMPDMEYLGGYTELEEELKE